MRSSWNTLRRKMEEGRVSEVPDRVVLDSPNYAAADRATMIHFQVEDVDLTSWQSFWESLLKENNRDDDRE